MLLVRRCAYATRILPVAGSGIGFPGNVKSGEPFTFPGSPPSSSVGYSHRRGKSSIGIVPTNNKALSSVPYTYGENAARARVPAFCIGDNFPRIMRGHTTGKGSDTMPTKPKPSATPTAKPKPKPSLPKELSTEERLLRLERLAGIAER